MRPEQKNEGGLVSSSESPGLKILPLLLPDMAATALLLLLLAK
jgi:hypothetical protein